MQCLCEFITAVIGIGSAFTVWPIYKIKLYFINKKYCRNTYRK